MNKLAVVFVGLVAVAVGVFLLFPNEAQWVLFSAVIRGNVLVLKYWHNASDAQQSLESLSIEQLLRFRDWSSPDYQISRRNLDSFGRLVPVGPDVRVDQVNITRNDGGFLPLYWLTPATHNNKTILFYLHGGAYIAGSFVSHSGSVAELVRRAEARAIFVDYRLAPEHTFPAMVDDAITAYKWLIYDQKISAQNIVFVGDSAGGGLVLLTLIALQDEDKGTVPLPNSAVTMSAWTDLSTDRPSYEKNEQTDAIIKEAFLVRSAAWATNTKPEDRASRKSSKFSPIFAPAEKLAKLPPIYMSVGDAEVMHDDTVHFAGKATQAGADIKLTHVWAYFYHFVPEADREMTHMTNWIKRQQKRK